jgi:hypothetical protein
MTKPTLIWKTTPLTGGQGWAVSKYRYEFFKTEQDLNRNTGRLLSFELFGYPTCCAMTILHDYWHSDSLTKTLIKNTLQKLFFEKDASNDWHGVTQFNAVYDRVNGGYGHVEGPSQKKPKYYRFLEALKEVTKARKIDTFYNTRSSFKKIVLYQFDNPSHRNLKYDKE